MKKLLFAFVSFVLCTGNVFSAVQDEVERKIKWNSDLVYNALMMADFQPLERVENKNNPHFRFYELAGISSFLEGSTFGVGRGVYGGWDGVSTGSTGKDRTDYYKTIFEQIYEYLFSSDYYNGVFSFRDAAVVCGKFLPRSNDGAEGSVYGRNIDHGAACVSFIKNLVEYNKQFEVVSLQDKPLSVCNRLIDESVIVARPALCGGHCKIVGDDRVYLYYKDTEDSFVVNDFCDGLFEFNGEHWFIIDKSGKGIDVSNLSQEKRKEKLAEFYK